MSAAPGATRPDRPENGAVSEARRIADVLIRAQSDRRPIPPFTRKSPFLSVDTAYEAQSLVIRHRLAAGETMIGAKLGLTSRVKRQALGIHEPVFGRLTSGMVVPHGGALALDELIHPRAEPEIAFLVRERNGPDHDRPGPGGDGGDLPGHRGGRLPIPSRSACPTPSPTTRAQRGSSSAPGVALRTRWSTSASSAASSGPAG